MFCIILIKNTIVAIKITKNNINEVTILVINNNRK